MKTTPLSPKSIFQTLRRLAGADGQAALVEAEQETREFTIDELARTADTTVRNVRAYQDRGLLPPPERRGRSGIYSDVHLARLRIIGQLLKRGYTLANIRDLITAWEEGRDLNDILGLEVVVTSPWSEEAPSYISYDELVADFGEHLTQEALLEAVEIGYIIPEGNRIRVPSPRLLNAGRELVAAGIPLEELLSQVNRVRAEVQNISDGFVELVERELLDKKYGDGLPSGHEVREISNFVQRVRPIADMIVSAELARTLDKSINKVLVNRLTNIIEQFDDSSEH